MPRKLKSGTDVLTNEPCDQSSEVVVAQDADVVLEFKDPVKSTEHLYQCSRAVLRNSSEYFDVLLDPGKFSEGIAIDAKLQELYKTHDGPIPWSKLPRVVVADIGELPGSKSSTATVFKLFLKILHDPNTPWPVGRPESVNLIALLAVVADRFGAHAVIGIFLRRRLLDATLLKDKKLATGYEQEVENRQKLYAGVIFDLPQWVLQCSAALIVDGPSRRTATALSSSEERSKDDIEAPWWRLPGGLEDEISCRREYVLETLSSIQKHFISLYTSRQVQCRLGYSSSPNCDSFQLGEMIRFFARKGLLRNESTYEATPEEGPEAYVGSVEIIIARLRECTSYQIDDFHRHCGLRSRLIPILDTISPLKQVWICLDCWKRDKSEESWVENPHEGTWHWAAKKARYHGDCRAHRWAKAMYTAAKRDWTPE